MTQEELATVQCIIAHPSKPKFMAIQHTTGYLPPTVKVPLKFDVGGAIQYVLDGIRRKYGLNTIALRHLARHPDYHCLELELRSKDARHLKAIWIGLADYLRMTGRKQRESDPFRTWLEEKNRGVDPVQRPPWEFPGWFNQASDWILLQLERLGIQPQGSVLQHWVLRYTGATLRVSTSMGTLYFKAAYAKPPREVALTRFLSDKWPGLITEVLAYDEERNWMLMPDYAPGGHRRGSPDDLAAGARALAKIQVESASTTGELAALGCELLGPTELKSYLENPGFMASDNAPKEVALSADERAEFRELVPRLRNLCDNLSGFGLPMMLIHPDFRSANLFVRNDAIRIIDWAGTAIGHPFFGLLKLLRQEHKVEHEELGRDRVVQAYLEPFQDFAPIGTLVKALEVSIQLQHAWRLLRWGIEAPYCEKGSVHDLRSRRFMPGIARELLEAHQKFHRRGLAN